MYNCTPKFEIKGKKEIEWSQEQNGTKEFFFFNRNYWNIFILMGKTESKERQRRYKSEEISDRNPRGGSRAWVR